MSTTIAQSVLNLQTDLSNIKSAVNKKGVYVDHNAGFASIAGYINQIPTSSSTNIAKTYGRFKKCTFGTYMRTGGNNQSPTDCYRHDSYYSDIASGSDVIDIGADVPNIWNLPVGIYPCADTQMACSSYNGNKIVFEWKYRATSSSTTSTSNSATVSGITHIKIVSSTASYPIQYSTDFGATWVNAHHPVNIYANQYVEYSSAKIYISIQTISELTNNYANNEVQAWDSVNNGLVDLTSFSPTTGVYRVTAHKRRSDFSSSETVFVMIDGGTLGNPDHTLAMIKDS